MNAEAVSEIGKAQWARFKTEGGVKALIYDYFIARFEAIFTVLCVLFFAVTVFHQFVLVPWKARLKKSRLLPHIHLHKVNRHIVRKI